MTNETWVGYPYWCEECDEVPHKDWCRTGQSIYAEQRRRIKACPHLNPHSDSNICADCGGAIRVIPCNPERNK